MRTPLALFILLLHFPLPALAQSSAPSVVEKQVEECKNSIDAEMAKEHRYFRTTLFGQQSAAKAPIGTVFYDKDGASWYKWKQNEWRSLTPGYEGTTWSDTLMNELHEFATVDPTAGGNPKIKEITGIFQTPRVLTSTLIPYILQSTRAFQCRLDIVCGVAGESLKRKKTDPNIPQDIALAVQGCTGYKTWQEWTENQKEPLQKSIPACHFADAEKFDEAQIRTYCLEADEQLMLREIETLKVLVEYDSAYRSLLQFAGMFDQFMLSWKWTITGSIRQATTLIGTLSRIPCFIGSCDASPLPPATP